MHTKDSMKFKHYTRERLFFMDILENLKNGVNVAISAIADAAQILVEKNKIAAQINRVKVLIKNESLKMNKNYAALGRYYYNAEKGVDSERATDIEQLISDIDASKETIACAQDRYKVLMEELDNVGRCKEEAPDSEDKNIPPEDFAAKDDVTSSDDEDSQHDDNSEETVSESAEETTEESSDNTEQNEELEGSENIETNDSYPFNELL